MKMNAKTVSHQRALCFAKKVNSSASKSEPRNLARAYLHLRERARSVERLRARLRVVLLKVDWVIAELDENS